jgi:hypothetical protein
VATPDSIPASIGSITDRFNNEYAAEFGGPVAAKWVGHVVRKVLRLATIRSGGVYVVPASEIPKIEALSIRYNGASPRARDTRQSP